MKAPPAFPLLTALVCLGATGPALADANTWTASQNRGPQWDCVERAENTMWKITETDDTILLLSDALGRIRINARRLKPDGSGRIEFKDNKGKPIWIELDAGHGPRKIRFNSGNRACIWTLEPMSGPAPTASPTGKFDGVWSGQVGSWTVSLKVLGQKGELSLNCPAVGSGKYEIAVDADGKIDFWLSGNGFTRRLIKTQLPKFAIPQAGSGACAPGDETLTRQ